MRLRTILSGLLRRNLDRSAAAEAVASYQEVFSSPVGEALLMDLVLFTDLYGLKPPKDGEEALYKAGQRSVVMKIMTMIENEPELRKRLGEIS